MWRWTFERTERQALWHEQSDTVSGERASHSENPPAPGELLFQTGIVLAATLGFVLAVQLLLAAMSIPAA